MRQVEQDTTRYLHKTVIDDSCCEISQPLDNVDGVVVSHQLYWRDRQAPLILLPSTSADQPSTDQSFKRPQLQQPGLVFFNPRLNQQLLREPCGNYQIHGRFGSGKHVLTAPSLLECGLRIAGSSELLDFIDPVPLNKRCASLGR